MGVSSAAFRRIMLALAALVTLGGANVVYASGYIPHPEWQSKMPSHKACVARLEAKAAEFGKSVKPKTFEADGGFRTVTLENRSGGVKILGRNSARYEARLWYHKGRLLDGGAQYEISHSWDETIHQCKGAILIINGAQGYTLSTFEPVSGKAP